MPFWLQLAALALPQPRAPFLLVVTWLPWAVVASSKRPSWAAHHAGTPSPALILFIVLISAEDSVRFLSIHLKIYFPLQTCKLRETGA